MKHNNRLRIIIGALVIIMVVAGCNAGSDKAGQTSQDEQEGSPVTSQLGLDPNVDNAYRLFYTNYNDLGMQMVEQILADDPDNTDALALRAAFYLRDDNGEDAKVDIDRVLELEPDHAFGHAVLSWYYGNIMEDNDKSLAETNLALELDPELALGYVQRGTLSSFFPDEIDLIADIKRSLELEPDYMAAHANLGLQYTFLQEYDAAAQEINKAIEINPGVDYVYYFRGILDVYTQQFDSGVVDLTRALDMGYEEPQVFLFRGIANLYLGEVEPALGDFTTTIEMGKEDETVYYYRGNAYSMLHQYEAAAQDFEKMLTYVPDDPDAMNNAAYMLALSEEGDLEKALEYADKAVELNPENNTSLYVQGFIYARMEEYDKALEIFNQLLENDYSYAYYGRALVYEQQGMVEEAISDYEAFLQDFPYDKVSQDATQRLEILRAEMETPES